ncbi:hypothetical protein GCK72_012650 [Caenorhabditis remanei]|uniref:Uncharacterized protein n=1 Tax=Caenorhabditis remanei TaxID=31234 RepID=A0A6A5GLP8_CAERE|nr:hypothetical protein GCK72_012650 [Caenorhabditis remanei]KAF1756197.1 hypothetical protein GCK72_012650 [Caenorhabditis remanei]
MAPSSSRRPSSAHGQGEEDELRMRTSSSGEQTRNKPEQGQEKTGHGYWVYKDEGSTKQYQSTTTRRPYRQHPTNQPTMANKNKKKTEQKKEKSEQWSPVTMKTIKWSITRELTRTRTLVSLANRALALERNTNNITVLDGYLAQLRNQLVLIEDLPENAIDLLKTNNKLCTQNVFEANRAQISDHLADRGHEGLVNQMITLIGDVTTTVNNFRSGRVSAIPETPPPPPSDVLAPGNAHTTDGIAPRRAQPEQHIPERSVQQTINQSDQLDPGFESNSGRHLPSSTKACESTHSSDFSAHPRSNILNRGSSEASQDIAEFADDLAVRIGTIEHTQTLLLDSSATANRAVKNLQGNMQAIQESMQKMQEMMYQVVNRQPTWQTAPDKKQESEPATTSKDKQVPEPSTSLSETPILRQSSSMKQENSSPPPPVVTPRNDAVDSPSFRQNPPGSQVG